MQVSNYAEYMHTYPWEWFATLTFQNKSNMTYAGKVLKTWRLNLQKKEGIQLAYMGACNQKNDTPHYHLLMFGRNNQGKTLVGVDREYWSSRWHGLSKIVPYSDIAMCAYTAKNFLMQHCNAEFVIYNHKLLMKNQINKEDEWNQLN